MENKKVIILHNAIADNSNPDEADVLHQAELVFNALQNLRFDPEIMPLSNELFIDIEKVAKKKPLFIFNLVESLYDKGELIYVGPAVLNALHIPFTGVPLDALFLTTNKVLAKKFMTFYDIPTPAYYEISQLKELKPHVQYILKPKWEEGSVGLDEENVFTTHDSDKLLKISKLSTNHYFIEQFVEGREFNMSILGGNDGPKVLQPAEMIFKDFPEGKPKILGYKAKWEESSMEYQNTTRSFQTLENDSPLYRKLKSICEKCWISFGLRGYARVDFRIDKEGNPFVIEINGNPCIAPDSGFIAAASHAGYTNDFVIKKICEELN